MVDPVLKRVHVRARSRSRVPRRRRCPQHHLDRVEPLLEEALAIAEGRSDLQHLAPAAIAATDAAALAGRADVAADASDAALALPEVRNAAPRFCRCSALGAGRRQRRTRCGSA
jgi:hypothetical protein